MKLLETISIIISLLLVIFGIIVKLIGISFLHAAPLSYILLSIPFALFAIYLKIGK